MAVVDASVMTVFYAAEDTRRAAVADRMTGGDILLAPAHLDADVVSALRGLSRHSPGLRTAVPAALRHLASFPIRRVALAPLLRRMWELRNNVTPYDAAYVALAEQVAAPVLTCDARLATASGPRCTFELLS